MDSSFLKVHLTNANTTMYATNKRLSKISLNHITQADPAKFLSCSKSVECPHEAYQHEFASFSRSTAPGRHPHLPCSNHLWSKPELLAFNQSHPGAPPSESTLSPIELSKFSGDSSHASTASHDQQVLDAKLPLFPSLEPTPSPILEELLMTGKASHCI